MVIVSKARVYAEVNSQKPKEYYSFENYQFETNSVDPYLIMSKLGRGKYSEVFEAINIPEDSKVVLKVLKPVALHKVRKEIKIL